MRRLQILQCRESAQAERIDIVIAASIKDVSTRTLQRENVLILLTLMQWTVRALTQIIDQKPRRLISTLASCQQKLLLWHEMQRLNLLFKSFEDANIGKAYNIPHHDVFLRGSH